MKPTTKFIRLGAETLFEDELPIGEWRVGVISNPFEWVLVFWDDNVTGWTHMPKTWIAE